MELRCITTLIGRQIQKKSFRALLGVRCSSNKTRKDSEPSFYNRKGGIEGNFNKYYTSNNAYTFEATSAHRFNKARPGEYYSFESFLDPNEKSTNRILCSIKAIDWENENLPPLEKDLYQEPAIVRNRSTYDVKCFREDHNLVVKGTNIPNPILEFSDYQFPEELQRAFDELNFKTPMAIQSQTWPIALRGIDLIGIGQTGSGKTLGFVLPAIVKAINQEPTDGNGPAVVILAPTRELAQQTASVIESVTKYMSVNMVCLFGGVRKKVQIAEILDGPSIIVATPGRLLDILQLKIVQLKNCAYFVMDEADRMLDMGFQPQIRAIASQIRPDCQTLMWSATWPEEIQELAAEFLYEPIQINVGSCSLYANPNISQQIIMTDSIGKISALRDVIGEEILLPNAKILIFVETKRTATLLNMRLQRKGIACSDLHGDHNQMARNRVVNAFRKGIISIVIATDVASRGLDVNDITLVINYTMPKDIESYVHRIGRTGRANKEGRSLAFFTDEDRKLAKPLIRILQETGQKVPRALHTYCRSA